jgi:hypothetical protein
MQKTFADDYAQIMNSYGKWSVNKADQPRRCVMQLPGLSVLAALAIGLASCSQGQTEYTEKERLCIARRFTDYDATRLSQCVDVCKACLNGTVVTCNTSCKLKGAS